MKKTVTAIPEEKTWISETNFSFKFTFNEFVST